MKKNMYLSLVLIFVFCLGAFSQTVDLNLPYTMESRMTICDGTWNIERQVDMSLDLTGGACPGKLSYEFTFEIWSAPSEITRIWVSKNADMSGYRQVHYVDQDQGTRSGTVDLNKDEKYIRVWAKNKSWSSTKIFLNKMSVTRSVNIEQTSMNIDAYVKRPVTKNIKVNGSNLAGDLGVEIISGNTELFSIATTTISKAEAENGYELALTYSPLVKGDDECVIRVTDMGYTGSYDEITVTASATHLIEPNYGIVYVDNITTEETGTGSSWEKAISMEIINDAIAKGDVSEIWVKSGVYDIKTTIMPRGGVSVYGGFTGEEWIKENRNWTVNKTVLRSGNDGSVCVIGDRIGDNVRANIDGFVIEGAKTVRAIESQTANLAIVNCIVRDNSFTGVGAGASFGDACFAENTLFVNNISNDGAGAISLYGDGISEIRNCTFVNNQTVIGTATTVNAANASVFYNSIVAGTVVDGISLVEGKAVFNNSIIQDTDVDPMLDEDYKLMFGSPCIDMGDNRYVNSEFDLGGDGRIQGSVVDMGAYEYEYLNITGVVVGEGGIDGLGSYMKGATVKLTAIFDDGTSQKVSNWRVDGEDVGYESEYTFVAQKDMEVTLTIVDKADVIVNIIGLRQVYDGSAKVISYTTEPEGLVCNITYRDGDNVVKECVNAGDYEIEITFGGNVDYKPLLIRESMVIDPAIITIDELPVAKPLVYEQSLSESELSGGLVSVTLANEEIIMIEGIFSWTDPSKLPLAGLGNEYDVTFTPDNSNYGSKSNIKVVVDVNKATPTINITPNYSYIMYNQPLSISLLSDGEASTAGEFTWVDETLIANSVGNNEYMVLFTPTDINNYNPVQFPITVDVDKADINGVTFDAVNLVYDGKEHEVVITGELPEGVTVEYINNKATNVAIYNAQAKIIGGENYKDIIIETTMTITKADFPTGIVVFSDKLVKYDGNEHSILVDGVLPEGAKVIYNNNVGTEVGEYIATAQITDALNFNESEIMTATMRITNKTIVNLSITNTEFVYDGEIKGVEYIVNPSDIPLQIIYSKEGIEITSPTNVGIYDFEISYTEDDNYTGVYASGSMIITKATPNILTHPSAMQIVYEQFLQESMLSGEVSVDGTFTWVNGDIMPIAGQHSYEAVFIPSDIYNYNKIEGLQVSVTVLKADPIITVSPKAIELTYGQTLAESTLYDGEVSVDGVFEWIDGNVIYDAGLYSTPLIFTPADIDNYNSKTLSTLVKVNKASITGVTFQDVTTVYDAANHSIEIGGELPIGAAVYYQNNTAINAGIYNAIATIDGGKNFLSFELNAKLTIEKANITSDISFDDMTVTYNGMYHSIVIDEAILPTGVSVVYTNNKALNAGIYQAVAKIYGGVNYNDMDELIAVLEIKSADISDIVFNNLEAEYDGTLHSIEINGMLPLGVSVSYSNNYATDAGTYNATATLSGLNYNTKELAAILTIRKANIEGISFDDKTVVYDASFHSLEITGVLPNGLGVTYENNRGRDANTYLAKANIDGGLNYNSLILNATLTIEAAKINGINFNNKTVVYNGQQHSLLIEGELPTGTNIIYTHNTATDAGTYNATALISGDNYKSEELQAVLLIEKANATISSIPQASNLEKGNTLNMSMLTNGVASIAGSFAWENGEIVVSESGEFKVVFTPIDNANYNNAECMVEVKVDVRCVVNITNTIGGAISVDCEGIIVNDGDMLTANSILRLEAFSLEGYVFKEWWDGNNEPVREYSLNEDVEISAIFEDHTAVESLSNRDVFVTGSLKSVHVRIDNYDSETVKYQVYIYDISGKLVYQSNIDAPLNKISIDKQGAYIVKISTDGLILKTQKIIVY